MLARAALFVTHGGMNSADEALHAGVPMLVVPQGADQPVIARRVVEPGFRTAAAALKAAQHDAGGSRRAADELERYMHAAGSVRQPVPTDPAQRG